MVVDHVGDVKNARIGHSIQGMATCVVDGTKPLWKALACFSEFPREGRKLYIPRHLLMVLCYLASSIDRRSPSAIPWRDVKLAFFIELSRLQGFFVAACTSYPALLDPMESWADACLRFSALYTAIAAGLALPEALFTQTDFSALNPTVVELAHTPENIKTYRLLEAIPLVQVGLSSLSQAAKALTYLPGVHSHILRGDTSSVVFGVGSILLNALTSKLPNLEVSLLALNVHPELGVEAYPRKLVLWPMDVDNTLSSYISQLRMLGPSTPASEKLHNFRERLSICHPAFDSLTDMVSSYEDKLEAFDGLFLLALRFVPWSISSSDPCQLQWLDALDSYISKFSAWVSTRITEGYVGAELIQRCNDAKNGIPLDTTTSSGVAPGGVPPGLATPGNGANVNFKAGDIYLSMPEVTSALADSALISVSTLAQASFDKHGEGMSEKNFANFMGIVFSKGCLILCQRLFVMPSLARQGGILNLISFVIPLFSRWLSWCLVVKDKKRAGCSKTFMLDTSVHKMWTEGRHVEIDFGRIALLTRQSINGDTSVASSDPLDFLFDTDEWSASLQVFIKLCLAHGHMVSVRRKAGISHLEVCTLLTEYRTLAYSAASCDQPALLSQLGVHFLNVMREVGAHWIAQLSNISPGGCSIEGVLPASSRKFGVIAAITKEIKSSSKLASLFRDNPGMFPHKQSQTTGKRSATSHAANEALLSKKPKGPPAAGDDKSTGGGDPKPPKQLPAIGARVKDVIFLGTKRQYWHYKGGKNVFGPNDMLVAELKWDGKCVPVIVSRKADDQRAAFCLCAGQKHHTKRSKEAHTPLRTLPKAFVTKYTHLLITFILPADEYSLFRLPSSGAAPVKAE